MRINVELTIDPEGKSHLIEAYTDIEVEEMPVYSVEFAGTEREALDKAGEYCRREEASSLEVIHPDGSRTPVVIM